MPRHGAERCARLLRSKALQKCQGTEHGPCTRLENCLQELYDRCKELSRTGQLHTENVVQRVYKPFTAEEIAAKIAQLITPPEIETPVQVIFQTIESLHRACPTNTGDWYFTGNYPTPGGNRVVNKAFMNYMEGKNVRGY